MFIFKWFKKEKKVIKEPPIKLNDQMEVALWEIKERYDLETEEVEKTVLDKRRKIKHMNDSIKRKS
jgi:hypothetical protein